MRKAARHLTLARLPIFGCAGFIAFLFLANVWNYAVERDWPKLRIRSAAPLKGLRKMAPTPWTVEAFLAGETQKAASSNLGRAMPVFPISVRAKNQLVFSLFGSSAAPGVAVGRNGQLFEPIYIDEFCRRGDAPDYARISQWAATIREIQDATDAAGKAFVFLISPSKAGRYPADLPASAICAARATSMPDKLAPYVAALREKGVRFVDGAGLIAAHRDDFEIPLFPRGGTHWNLLGASLALEEMSRIAPSAIGPFAFTWAVAPEPHGPDRDLIDLLNLLWPDLTYPTAMIERAGAPGACEKAPRVLAMGGSFLHQIIVSVTRAPCPPKTDYWFYMRLPDYGIELGHYEIVPGEADGEKGDADLSILDRNLRDADLVVLEENEANIGLTQQVGHLRDATRRRAPL
ncbi:alginate O-acetyltransferase AlgX-related protein [Methylocystis sp. JAN1]|uniref:alginate O-acetyltransferase AlgX-related protein n=1 Tax=Methylocystis sp. JAN1 TaxID=3397211 RepID=UPI003FA1BF79